MSFFDFDNIRKYGTFWSKLPLWLKGGSVIVAIIALGFFFVHYRGLRQKNSDLKDEVAKLHVEKAELHREKLHLEEMVGPIYKLTERLYPDLETVTAIARLTEDIENVRALAIRKDQEIADLQEKAKGLESPTLSLFGAKIDIDESGYSTLLMLKASTNQPLVDIVLDAWIGSETDAKIIDISPTGMNLTEKDAQKIFEDGKRGHIKYSPMLPGLIHIVKIITTKPCTVRVAGSHNLKEFTFNLAAIFAEAESQKLKPPLTFEIVYDADHEEKVQRINVFGQPDTNADN